MAEAVDAGDRNDGRARGSERYLRHRKFNATTLVGGQGR